jgi:hypothetical protein
VHYAAIRQPRAAEVFIADLQARLHAGLDRLDQAVRTNTAGGVRITTRRGPAVDRGPRDGLAASGNRTQPPGGPVYVGSNGSEARNTGMSSLAVRTVRDNSMQ